MLEFYFRPPRLLIFFHINIVRCEQRIAQAEAEAQAEVEHTASFIYVLCATSKI